MEQHTGNYGQTNDDDEEEEEYAGGDDEENEEAYIGEDSDDEEVEQKRNVNTNAPNTEEEEDDDDSQDYVDITENYQSSTSYPVALELASLTVYCKSKPFKGINVALTNAKYEYACCVSEAASVDLFKHNLTKYVLLNQIQMTRVYPVGKRIMSSNYNPVPHWLCGSQVVALNYQIFDKGTDVII